MRPFHRTTASRRPVAALLARITLLFTGATMGLELAHLLEWPAKADYSGSLYTRLQESLYLWFGYAGGLIYLLAIAGGVTIAVLGRHRHAVRGRLIVAAAVQVVALAVFLGVVYPVNFQFPVHGSGEIPADWTALRTRWEVGHAIGFVLFAIAFWLQTGIVGRAVWTGRASADPG